MQNIKLLRKQRTKTRQIENQLERLQQQDPLYVSHKEEELKLQNILEKPGNECPFDKLSDELILHIFKWIPLKKLVKLSLVCKRWHKLINDESVWTGFDLSEKTVNVVSIMWLLNRGVRALGLAHTEIRKSISRMITRNDSGLKTLPAQLNFYLYRKVKLEYLDLTNSSIDVSSLNILLKHCQHLKKLSLESLTVDNQTFFYLSANQELNTLNLCQCTGIQTEGLITMLESLKSLVNLNISWTFLSRESVAYLCLNLPPCLVKLNISGFKKTLFDSDVENLVNNCPNLVELDLSDSHNLTNLSVQKVTFGLIYLEEVSFSRCYSIDPLCFLMLGGLKNLVALNLHHILKSNSFEFLKKHIPTLKYFNACLYSSIARPRNGNQKGVIWGHPIRQNLNSNSSLVN